MSPRWLREDERDTSSWERRQDERLENLLAALVVTLGEGVQDRMAATAGFAPTAVAALQWLGRGRGLRTRDLAEALGISSPGASQLVASLTAAGMVRRARSAHDRRQWTLHLTELGVRRTGEAIRARAQLVHELLATLPFPWRLRLLHILERLLTSMASSPREVLRICRYCDWNTCRHGTTAPCPVAIAQVGQVSRRSA